MINLGFWAKMKRESEARGEPILCLAPMADVTDSAFRNVIAKCSKQSFDGFNRLTADKLRTNHFVIWTEFVSADGLVLAHEEGKKKLMKDLEYSELERPIVAQLFSSRPENMKKAARLVAELGFDGVDINMGCPDKSIEKQGAGAAMIKNPSLAREVIRAAKDAVEACAKEKGVEPIPVSVKTRLGYNKDELETWLPELLAEEPAVITIHARTRKEMSKVPARWERIKKAVAIRDEYQKNKIVSEDTGISLLENSLQCSPQPGSQAPLQQLSSSDIEGAKTLIFGNGDVESVEQAKALGAETLADGVMLGRAIFGNPWLFANLATLEQSGQVERLVNSDIDPILRLKALKEHISLFDQNLGGVKSFAVMKKHFKSYLSFLVPFAAERQIEKELHELKDALLASSSAPEALDLIDGFIHKHCL
jgi:tRNA-dihydrouridine synthase